MGSRWLTVIREVAGPWDRHCWLMGYGGRTAALGTKGVSGVKGYGHRARSDSVALLLLSLVPHSCFGVAPSTAGQTQQMFVE